MRAVSDDEDPRRCEDWLEPRCVLERGVRGQEHEQVEAARARVDAQALASCVRARRVQTHPGQPELDGRQPDLPWPRRSDRELRFAACKVERCYPRDHRVITCDMAAPVKRAVAAMTLEQIARLRELLGVALAPYRDGEQFRVPTTPLCASGRT